MKDLQGDSNNYSPKEPQNTGRKDWVDVLIGIGLSILAYLLIGGITFGIHNFSIVCILDFIIIAALGILCVKFFRTRRFVPGIIILILASPLIFILIALGSCAYIMGGFK